MPVIVSSPPSNLLKNMTVVLLKMLTPISMSESYKNDVWFWWDFNLPYFLNILCLSEQIWADVICAVRFRHISTYLVLRDFHWESRLSQELFFFCLGKPKPYRVSLNSMHTNPKLNYLCSTAQNGRGDQVLLTNWTANSWFPSIYIYISTGRLNVSIL
jgi:hypothetical protein